MDGGGDLSRRSGGSPGPACVIHLDGILPQNTYVRRTFELAPGLGRSPPYVDPNKKDTQSSERCITSGDETSTEVRLKRDTGRQARFG